jgi:hypothetical protein
MLGVYQHVSPFLKAMSDNAIANNPSEVIVNPTRHPVATICRLTGQPPSNIILPTCPQPDLHKVFT